MDTENDVCPVCTLFLRPGITLKAHLNSHPKQKVIDALINLTSLKSNKHSITSETTCDRQIAKRTSKQHVTKLSSESISTANHSFIYQQFMSTAQPPLGQQCITIPTTFNSSMMYPPYVYQQQLIMPAPPPPLNIINSKMPVVDFSLRESISEDHLNEVVHLNNVSVDVSNRKDLDEEIMSNCSSAEVASSLQFENNMDDVNSKDLNVISPGSGYLKIHQNIDKACQTYEEHEDTDDEKDGVAPETFCTDEMNIEQPSEQVLNLNGVQLMLFDNFMTGQIVSKVNDFECNNEEAVLMNIGSNDYDKYETNDNLSTENFQDDGFSRHSGTNISIRAHENMPPRGELSGQESNGTTSDMSWGRVRCESNSAASYDLFARETWEGSDGSDHEAVRHPFQNRVPVYNESIDDTPTIISVTEPPLNFKCPTCGQGFKCPKERKAHQTEKHSKTSLDKYSKSGLNLIGANILNTAAVKKLVIKPKRTIEIKNENNFDELFKNKVCENISNIDNKFSSDPLVFEAVKGENKCNMIEDDKNISCFECSICVAAYPDMKLLKKHKQLVHGFSNGFGCETCGEVMKDRKTYTEHLRKHPLECRLCGKYFYRRQNMKLHMKRHLGIKPFVCEYCEKPFFSKQKLQEHRNVHTGEAPIKCNLCGDTFRRHSNLIQHRNTHHIKSGKKVKDYICHCGEVLHTKKKLAWHQEIHDAKPKACPKCNEKFIHMASLTRHVRRAHNSRFVPDEKRSTENVECPICNNVYLKSSLETHIRQHSDLKKHSCTICNKEFSTKWNLKLHKWIHASRTSKPFKCDQCKAAFIRESDFTSHMNSHKCLRPYTCNYCGAQFIRKNNCQRHVKEHERDKTFTCQVCGKAFHRSYYLKDHLRTHNGFRPFICHICGKTSATKSNHNKHLMIHHAKEPVNTEN